MERLGIHETNYNCSSPEQGGVPGKDSSRNAEFSCHGCSWKTRRSKNSSKDRDGERKENTMDHQRNSRCRGGCSNRWRTCARSHKCTAHNQSRTPYLSSPGGHMNRYINSKLSSFNWRQYSDPCGLLKGIDIHPISFLGITRIILLSFFVIYLCIPTTVAAPQRQPHSSESPTLSQSPTAGVDQLMELLLKELPPTKTSTRRDSRLSPRTGRSGRQRVSNRQDQGILPVEEIFPRIREEFRNASCQQPRDTILDAFHELGIDRGFTHLFPQCILVKRCKNGGCCQEHQECTAIEFAFKTFYFLQDINSSPIVHDVREDTLCGCVDICGLSQDECPAEKTLNPNTCSCECPTRCPEPFLLNDRCECDCLMSNKQCKYFYRGKRGTALSSSECSCVRRGECQAPPCANGHFSRHHCRCVNSSS